MQLWMKEQLANVCTSSTVWHFIYKLHCEEKFALCVVLRAHFMWFTETFTTNWLLLAVVHFTISYLLAWARRVTTKHPWLSKVSPLPTPCIIHDQGPLTRSVNWAHCLVSLRREVRTIRCTLHVTRHTPGHARSNLALVPCPRSMGRPPSQTHCPALRLPPSPLYKSNKPAIAYTGALKTPYYWINPHCIFQWATHWSTSRGYKVRLGWEQMELLGCCSAGWLSISLQQGNSKNHKQASPEQWHFVTHWYPDMNVTFFATMA